MTKTIAEQFEEEYRNPGVGSYNVMKNAIERIEERLAKFDSTPIPSPSWMREIEERIKELQTTVNNQGMKQYEISKAMCGLEERITALEHPVQQAGEWIEPVNVVYWCFWDDGDITVEDVFGLCIWDNKDKNLLKVMPYVPGMKKPDTPEATK